MLHLLACYDVVWCVDAYASYSGQDKWRNMNVMASGLGSRHRAKLALKNQTIPKPHESMALSTVVRSGEEVVDAKPLAISRGPLRIDGSKKAISRL